VKEMTSLVDGEVKKQKGAFNYDLFELKLDILQEFYRIYNSVCNEAYKYDFMIVVNCNSYNIFSCV
jgi:hypothetical protein